MITKSYPLLPSLWARVQMLFLTSIALVASTTQASAHVRWFTDPDEAAAGNFPVYSITDLPVLIWIGIGLVLVSIAIFLDGRLPKIPVADTKVRHDVMELMRIFTGMSLLLIAYGGDLIAPHMSAYGAFGYMLVFLQAVIGILLIANRFVHHAAILLVVLLLGTMVQYGFIQAFEYVNFIGIALFLFFNHVPNQELRERLKPYSVDMLRIFTGIALVTLGVTEKLTGAILGQSFIANFQWNFMPALGFEWYTDQLFVLSAGAVEVVFGVIMILGVITRLNTLVIAGFMLTSNIVFILVGENEKALVELIGHMPIIASALILLLLGYGQRIKLRNPTLPRETAKTNSAVA